MRRSIAVVLAICGCLAIASVANARVLLVGTHHGVRGQFKSVQAAVNAAHPGDWILIAPGDYKTTAGHAPKGHAETPAAVLITKPRIHIRGMNRNTVIVDGTKAGSARCSRRASAQNYGPRGKGGALGLNGIIVWKADNVSVQNLTICNFLHGSGHSGNGIWWNGGDGSGKIGGRGFIGSYLTATSTFYRDEKTAAAYGIFSSNWDAGTWDWTYTSNFSDSGYYVGACQDRCFQTVDHAWAQYNALGYSGTNSGGPLLIENSQFDRNQDGFDTNSQNNSDWPSPQSGRCPIGVKPQVAGAHSCWIFYNNFVHDNNNPNVPSAGAAAAGPVGTGVSIEGRNDTIMHNRFQNNGAWGVVLQPYPDTETPPSNAIPCVSGTRNFSFLGISIACVYDDWNNALVGNAFTHNGFFGNPTNGDFAQSTFLPGHPVNCYSANTDTGGKLTSSPLNLQSTNATCGRIATAPDRNLPFVFQSLCDTQVFGPGTPCLSGAHYPRRTKVVMHPIPKGLRTMPNPCAGVPANPWCTKGRH
jgi:hypothetical protein